MYEVKVNGNWYVVEGFDKEDATEKAKAEFGDAWSDMREAEEDQYSEYVAVGSTVHEVVNDKERFVGEFATPQKAEEFASRMNARKANS